jgi:Acetyltransferases
VAAGARTDDRPDVAVRAASPDDHLVLVEMAEAFYAEDGFTTPLRELHANLEQLITSRAARVAIAEMITPIGFAITTIGFGLESGPVAELEDLYVHPDHRRQGVAARLISDSADWAQLRGAKQLEVVIAPNGLDVSHLHAYYDRLGFRDEGRTLRTKPLG